MRNLKWLIQPLSGFALGMLLIVNLTIYLFWFVPGLSNLDNSLDHLSESLTRSLAFESTSALHSDDRVAVSNIINRFADQPAVISAAVVSNENNVRLSSRVKLTTETGRTSEFPIHFGDEQLGVAELTISEANLTNWRSQALTSWSLFNFLNLFALGGFIFWRSNHHQSQWDKISAQLSEQMPNLHQQLVGTPEQQLKQVMNLLSDPVEKHGQLLRHMSNNQDSGDTERLLEQIELVSGIGTFDDVALVAIQCQNWEELIREYDAPSLQLLWNHYEELMLRVSELYSGILLPDGFSLAFGLDNSESFALNAVCSARVLQLALEQISEQHGKLSPRFGIAVSAGPAFISKTYKHGIALPLVTGDADNWLAQIKAIQPIDQVLLAEPVLQFDDVNRLIEASHFRDITLRDGYRLEVWELERFKEQDDLLRAQARTLANTN